MTARPQGHARFVEVILPRLGQLDRRNRGERRAVPGCYEARYDEGWCEEDLRLRQQR